MFRHCWYFLHLNSCLSPFQWCLAEGFLDVTTTRDPSVIYLEFCLYITFLFLFFDVWGLNCSLQQILGVSKRWRVAYMHIHFIRVTVINLRFLKFLVARGQCGEVGRKRNQPCKMLVRFTIWFVYMLLACFGYLRNISGCNMFTL